MIRLCRFLGILAIVTAIGWVGAAWVESLVPQRISHAPKPKPPEPLRFAARPVAVGCSASRCHGDAVPADATQRPGEAWKWAATVWSMSDAHQRAYEVLESPLSLAIGKHLGGPRPAQNSRCLVCHSDPALSNRPADPEAVQARSEGVGCRACHGDPTNWFAAHLSWGKADDRRPEYQKHGMTWMNDLPSRAAVCVKCHVGAGPEGDLVARDVDHDLIAAGHPRLNFDFGTYLRAMPPHWSEKDRRTHRPPPPDFAERAWSAGRLAGMQASLDLLAYRTDPKSLRPWPEFAEFNCWDCHHDLSVGTRPAASAGGSRGRFGWHGAAELEMLAAKGPATALNDSMRTPFPDKARVYGLIPAAKSSLKAPPDSPAALFRWLVADEQKDSRPNWDDATWLYQVLVAVEIDRRSQGKKSTELDDEFARLRDKLRLDVAGPDRARWNSPRMFDPVSARELLLDLSNRLRQSTE